MAPNGIVILHGETFFVTGRSEQMTLSRFAGKPATSSQAGRVGESGGVMGSAALRCQLRINE